MRFSILFSICVFFSSVSAFFTVTSPGQNIQWVNGQVNTITWEKGIDNVNGVDIELKRMSQDGLILVAQNVLTKPGGVNLFLENVPPAEDYVAICLNASVGILHGTSQRFTILAAGSTPSSPSTVGPIAKAATVTVSGGPNAKGQFATTLPPVPWSGAAPRLLLPSQGVLGGFFGAGLACLAGAAWTLL